MQIDLSPEELDLLVTMLSNRQGPLLREIRRTDTRDFRDSLKKEEELLERLLAKLQRIQSAAA
jgi:hypothetical protein